MMCFCYPFPLLVSFILLSMVFWCIPVIHSPCTSSLFCLVSGCLLISEVTLGRSLLVVHMFPCCGVEAGHQTWMYIPCSNSFYFSMMVVINPFLISVSMFLVMHESKIKSCFYNIIILFFLASNLMQDNIVPQY